MSDKTSASFIVIAFFLSMFSNFAMADDQYADNALYQNCLKHSINRMHDCACIADNEAKVRQYLSDNSKVETEDSPAVKSHRNKIAEYEERIKQTDNESRIAQFNRIIAREEERILKRTTKPAPDSFRFNALFKYFQTDVNERPETCRSRQKAYDIAMQGCLRNWARNDPEQGQAYCTCISEDTVERWMNPVRPRDDFNMAAAANKCKDLKPK